MTMFSLIAGLTLLGLLSPLLTFLKLFQLKEWRWDRLQEHLRKEGWISQLFGQMRGFVLVIGFPLFASPFWEWVLVVLLGTLALMSIAQVMLRKQPMPVWTQKTVMVTVLALAIDCLAIWLLLQHLAIAALLPLLPFLQPAVVLLAWFLLSPLDLFLKKRIMEQARALRAQHPELTVIGIAGSVGKTTTKELLKLLLTDLHPLATPAHVNTEMGVAAWLTKQFHANHSPLTAPFIIEMGAYREGEIALLARIAQPTLGILTTLGSDHLALFGSEEAIRSANAELIQALPKNGHAFIVVTDDASKAIAQNAPCPVTTVSPQTESTQKEDGLHLTIDDHDLHVPLQGVHHVTNILLAVSVARHLGISWERISTVLKGFRPMSHTFSITQERDVTILDDTYNISFLSFEAALQWAKTRSERPRILLTNGLLETGEQEDDYHRELGEIANGCIERAIFGSAGAANAFRETFHGEVELLSPQTKAPKDSLLLCVGRMPLATIQRILP